MTNEDLQTIAETIASEHADELANALDKLTSDDREMSLFIMTYLRGMSKHTGLAECMVKVMPPPPGMRRADQQA